MDNIAAMQAAAVQRAQQKDHEARIAERRDAETQTARQQIEDRHKEVKKVAKTGSSSLASPKPPMATVAKKKVASKPLEMPQRKAKQLKPAQDRRVANVNVPPVAERPVSKVVENPKEKQVAPAKKAAPIKENAKPSAPQMRRAQHIIDGKPQVMVASSELVPEFEPGSEIGLRPEMPTETTLVSHEGAVTPRPERVLVYDEAGLHFVEPSQEDIVDIGEILLQDARNDLGILPPAPEKQVNISDVFKMPEIDLGTEVDMGTDIGVAMMAVREEIQPKTVEVLDVIQERVKSLEPEQVEVVEVLLMDLQEAIDILDVPSEEVSAEERVQLVVDTVTEILDILDIPYDEEIVAEIIVFLRAKRDYQYLLAQQKTTQYFEEGTHERLSHVTNLFQDVKDLLEPLHARLGRTALATNII